MLHIATIWQQKPPHPEPFPNNKHTAMPDTMYQEIWKPDPLDKGDHW